MTGALDDNLEQRLAALTAWPGDQTRVWRRALKAVPSNPRGILRWMRSWKVMAGAAVFVLFVTAVAVNVSSRHFQSQGQLALESLQNVGSAFYVSPYQVSGPSPNTAGSQYRGSPVGTPAASPAAEQSARAPARARHVSASVGEQYFASDDGGTPRLEKPVQSPDAPQAGSADATDRTKLPLLGSPRHVIRKATIELKTADVRAVFLKAAMALNEARGEYVESSELTGAGKEAQAHLTIRVAAEHLDGVLNQLRQLGEVRSERVEGQDVTAQVVDVEARLRNEQRVEAELLQLLEKRKDAPLKEVLELRDKIGQIRGEIEKLTAQRDQLSRLVSLATVLILIRPGDAPLASESHLGAYFAQKCKTAWTDGMQFLADTLATLLSILIGGLVWWVVAIVVVVLVYRRWQRKASGA